MPSKRKLRERASEAELKLLKAIALSCHPTFKRIIAEEYQLAYSRALSRFDKTQTIEAIKDAVRKRTATHT